MGGAGFVSAGPDRVWFKQVQVPLTWLRAFFSLSEGPLICERFSDLPGTYPVIMFDASTTGGGALLWVLPHQREVTPDELKHITPWAYLAVGWDRQDEVLATASIGCCASQARWEYYMMLLAIVTWRSIIFQSKGKLRILGDALGIMHSAVRFKSKDPVINLMCMEMALIFAPAGAELEAIHLWSEVNDIADALSRLHEGAAVPELCTKVARGSARRDAFRVLGRLLPLPVA